MATPPGPLGDTPGSCGPPQPGPLPPRLRVLGCRVMATYSHLMPDDRERARRAMDEFFTRPAEQDSAEVSRS